MDAFVKVLRREGAIVHKFRNNEPREAKHSVISIRAKRLKPSLAALPIFMSTVGEINQFGGFETVSKKSFLYQIVHSPYFL